MYPAFDSLLYHTKQASNHANNQPTKQLANRPTYRLSTGQPTDQRTNQPTDTRSYVLLQRRLSAQLIKLFPPFMESTVRSQEPVFPIMREMNPPLTT